jgi:long-chain acyl-CoA synthetase
MPEPDTVTALVDAAARRHGPRVGLRHEGTEITFTEGDERTMAIARALIAAGVGPGDRVAIWSSNRPEWVLTDLAVARLGAVVVPIYATSSIEEAEFILTDTRARVIVCDDRDQAAIVVARWPALPALELVVGVGKDAEPGAWPAGVLPFAKLEAGGACVEEERVRELTRAVDAQDVYRIIYTSGTTGPPKGCPLTHANVIAAVTMRAQADPVGPGDRFFLFLPLAHVYGSSVQLLGLAYGATTILLDGSMDELIDRLAIEKPTHLFAVPRFVQKLASRVTRGHEPEAVAVAVDAVEAGDAGAAPELFAAIRAASGGELRRAAVGGAPIAADILRLFRAAGVLVVQGYGMTETAGFAALSTPDDYRFGAVGRPLAGMDVRLTEEGEVLLRGPNVFAGYLSGDGNDFGGLEDGWLRTGDLGRIGEDGLLEITGRLKNLIVTAGGKNIAPENLERDLLRSPLIEQAVVCGDGRPFPIALIAVDHDAVGDGDAHELVQGAVDAVNAAYARPERIKAFAILEEPLSAVAGELTASMKVRRAVVEERRAAVIEGLYVKPPTA